MSEGPLEWKTKYALGVDDIDYQHHFFLDLVNRLSDELKNDGDRTYQAALITELNAYVHFHFISEENMMNKAGFPLLGAHRKLHADLLGQLSMKELELELEHSETKANEIIEFLVKWFLHHTALEDKKFADYLHDKS